jgi:dTDP-4-dehydrorhamnose reductase
MSIIGPDLTERGIGLFNWYMCQSGDISGYTKAIWNGITTIELAKGIDAAIKQNLNGLYHLVPNNNISKFELLQLFKEVFSQHEVNNIIPVAGVIVDKTLINTREDFNFKVSGYKAMVDEMKDWIGSHKNLYKHYEAKI